MSVHFHSVPNPPDNARDKSVAGVPLSFSETSVMDAMDASDIRPALFELIDALC